MMYCNERRASILKKISLKRLTDLALLYKNKSSKWICVLLSATLTVSSLTAFSFEANNVNYDLYDATGRPSQYNFAPLGIIEKAKKGERVSLVQLSKNNTKSFASGYVNRHGKSNLFGASSAYLVDKINSIFGIQSHQINREAMALSSSNAHIATAHFYLSSLVAENAYDSLIAKTANTRSKFKIAIHKSAQALALAGLPALLAFELSSFSEAVIKDFKSNNPGFNSVKNDFASAELQGTLLQSIASWGLSSFTIDRIKTLGGSPIFALLKQVLPNKSFTKIRDQVLKSVKLGKASSRTAKLAQLSVKASRISHVGIATTFAELTALYTLSHYWNTALEPIVNRMVNSYKRGKFISNFNRLLNNLHKPYLSSLQFSSITRQIEESMKTHRQWLESKKSLEIMPVALSIAIQQGKVKYLYELEKLPLKDRFNYIYKTQLTNESEKEVQKSILNEYLDKDVIFALNRLNSIRKDYDDFRIKYFKPDMNRMRRKELYAKRASVNVAEAKLNSLKPKMSEKFNQLFSAYSEKIDESWSEVVRWSETVPEDLGYGENNSKSMHSDVGLNKEISYEQQSDRVSVDTLNAIIEDKKYTVVHLDFLQQVFYSYLDTNFYEKFPQAIAEQNAYRITHLSDHLARAMFYDKEKD